MAKFVTYFKINLKYMLKLTSLFYSSTEEGIFLSIFFSQYIFSYFLHSIDINYLEKELIGPCSYVDFSKMMKSYLNEHFDSIISNIQPKNFSILIHNLEEDDREIGTNTFCYNISDTQRNYQICFFQLFIFFFSYSNEFIR